MCNYNTLQNYLTDFILQKRFTYGNLSSNRFICEDCAADEKCSCGVAILLFSLGTINEWIDEGEAGTEECIADEVDFLKETANDSQYFHEYIYNTKNSIIESMYELKF